MKLLMNRVILFIYFIILCFYVKGNEVDVYTDEDVVSGRAFEEQLECLLNSFKNDLDPTSLGERSLNISIPNEVDLELDFDNLVISNISTMYGNHLSMTGLSRLEIDVTIPLLTIEADRYNIWADIGIFQIVGEGAFLMNLRDVQLAFNLTLRVGNPPVITGATSFLAIREVESQMENLMGGGVASDYMNQILSDMIPDIIDYMQETVSEYMNNLIMTLANDMLSESSLADLLSTIANACD